MKGHGGAPPRGGAGRFQNATAFAMPRGRWTAFAVYTALVSGSAKSGSRPAPRRRNDRTRQRVAPSRPEADLARRGEPRGLAALAGLWVGDETLDADLADLYERRARTSR